MYTKRKFIYIYVYIISQLSQQNLNKMGPKYHLVARFCPYSKITNLAELDIITFSKGQNLYPAWKKYLPTPFNLNMKNLYT